MSKRFRPHGVAIYLRGGLYWADFRSFADVGGRREPLKTSDAATAVDRVGTRKAALEEARAGRTPRGIVMFEDLVGLIRDNYENEDNNSWKRAGQAIHHLRATFGQRQAGEITTAGVVSYQTQRKRAGAAQATVAYELAILRRMFTLAREQELVDRVPVISTPAVKNARKGFLTAEHMAELLPALDTPVIRDVIAFMFYTGWRGPSEVFPLQWSQVDEAAGEIRLDPATTKNDEPRVFPYAAFPQLEAVIERRRAAARPGVPWVFHRNGKEIRDCAYAWRRACKAVGLEGRIMHDLRRSAVRNLVNAGVPEKTAMILTGHKTRQVFDRYFIVSRGETDAAVARLAAHLENAAENAGTRTGTRGRHSETPKSPTTGANALHG